MRLTDEEVETLYHAMVATKVIIEGTTNDRHALAVVEQLIDKLREETPNGVVVSTEPAWVLMNEDLTIPYAVGEHINHSGEMFVITHASPPHKPSSSGKVTIRSVETNEEHTYYPSVLGLKFTRR